MGAIWQFFILTNLVTFSANTSWYLYNFRRNTINSLLSHGYKVVCISPDDGYSDKLIDLGCIWKEIKVDNSGSNPFRDVQLLISFLKIYREFQPIAAFHFTIKNNIYGTIAASIFKIKSINNISGLGTTFIHKGLKSNIAKFLYRLTLPFSSLVHVQNEDDEKILKKTIPSISNKIFLIPGSGVDTNRFNSNLRKSNSIPSEPFRFLYAGRFIEDKGLNEIIEAVTAINAYEIRCEFWLVGPQDNKNISSISPSKIDLWRKIPGLKIFEPTDQIELILAEVDCFVLPSYREGMPKSILEACSMSLPVVCTDVAGCRSIITDDENGYLCEVKNSNSLKDALEKVLQSSPEKLQSLGSNGRKKVNKFFNEKIIINGVLTIIKNIESNHAKK